MIYFEQIVARCAVAGGGGTAFGALVEGAPPPVPGRCKAAAAVLPGAALRFSRAGVVFLLCKVVNNVLLKLG